jgi:integrase
MRLLADPSSSRGQREAAGTGSKGHAPSRLMCDQQVNTLADAIDERYRVAIYLAAYGGLRAGELWALRVDRLNILAATVDVAASMSEAGGLHAGPTKTGKRRTITVPRFLA